MLYIILHQVIWGAFSFFVFFFLMNKFVFNKINKIAQKRDAYFNKLESQIEGMDQKTAYLEEISNKMLNEEIPNKQKFFIESKLEHIAQELEIDLLNEKERLQEEFAKCNVKLNMCNIQNLISKKQMDDMLKRLIKKVN